MVPLLFVHPILDKISALIQIIPSHDRDLLHKRLHVESWQQWIQEEKLCIHCIHYEDPNKFFISFQNLLAQGNSYAQLLDKTFSLAQLSFHLEKVLDLMIDPTPDTGGYDFCYALPLLPQHLENHRDYCRKAMHEKKEQTIAVCKDFGMIFMKKWIQISQEGMYILYYQKMRSPLEKERKSFLALKDNPKALEATRSLREQTGLSFEELCPKVTCLEL